MKELTSAGAWAKTCHLIQEKYGKKLEFRSLNLVEGFEPSYSKGDDLIVPLKAHNHYLGDVIINRGSMLSAQEKSEVVDLIKFLIEPQAYNIHLKRVEESQSSLTAVRSNNIISLFNHHVSNHVNHHEINPEKLNSERKVLSNIIHLKAVSALSRHKVAMKIHEMSNGLFMTRLQDVSSTIHSAADLMTMGEMSIYIEDLSKLNPSELQLLEDFAKLKRTENVLFLVGSNLSEEELEKSTLHTNLKNDLIGFFFDIDRVPLSQQTNEDVLDLLFFTIDHSLS